MTDTPAVFDPKALQDRIARSVQSTFGMLIPEDQFQGMVEKEVKAYFEIETKMIMHEEKRNPDSWNNRDAYMVTYAMATPFRRQVWDQLSKLITANLDQKLMHESLRASVDNYRHFDSNGQPIGGEAVLSDMLLKHLDKIAPKMAASMFERIFVGAVQEAKREVMEEVTKKLEH